MRTVQDVETEEVLSTQPSKLFTKILDQAFQAIRPFGFSNYSPANAIYPMNAFHVAVSQPKNKKIQNRVASVECSSSISSYFHMLTYYVVPIYPRCNLSVEPSALEDDGHDDDPVVKCRGRGVAVAVSQFPTEVTKQQQATRQTYLR